MILKLTDNCVLHNIKDGLIIIYRKKNKISFVSTDIKAGQIEYDYPYGIEEKDILHICLKLNIPIGESSTSVWNKINL